MYKAMVGAVALLSAGVVSASSVQALSVSAAEALPADLTRNAYEGAGASLFKEKSGVTVADGSVTVDYLAADLTLGTTYTGVTNFSSGSALGAGTYDSFLIHFDPDIARGNASTSGTFTFAGDVVALILSNGRGNKSKTSPNGLLNVSDATFGDTTYDTHVGRRAEGNTANGDKLAMLSANTIQYSFTANSNHVDNIRVITEVAPVPLPAGAALMLTAIGGLVAFRRKKTA